jgi:DNA-directed RNA polymerase subunit RPC12/RpoP
MATQLQSYAMKCSVCGASLRVTPDAGRFVCTQCGSELLVERGGGTLSLKPVTEAISKVQVGTDKTAAELALKRLQGELAALDWQKNNLENSYAQQINQAQGSVFMVPIMLVIFSLIGGVILAVVYSSGAYLAASLFIGAGLGVVAFGIGNKSQKDEIAVISTAMTRDIKAVDLLIRQTRQKIAKNRAIADS